MTSPIDTAVKHMIELYEKNAKSNCVYAFKSAKPIVDAFNAVFPDNYDRHVRAWRLWHADWKRYNDVIKLREKEMKND